MWKDRVKFRNILTKLRIFIASFSYILKGDYVLITETNGKVLIKGMMPEKRLKAVIEAFNNQLNPQQKPSTI